MLNLTLQEKDLVHTMLYALLNHRNTNEWERGFLQSMIDKDQSTFSQKQADKISSIIHKCQDYDFPNLLNYILNENTYKSGGNGNYNHTNRQQVMNQPSADVEEFLPYNMVNN